MKRIVFCLILAFAAVLTAAENMKWNAGNGFGKWGGPVRMTLERKNGILLINSKGNDPCFFLDKLTMKPEDCNLFAIEYRAPEAIPAGNQGKIYFL